jgi:hypothetical protein
MATILSGAWVSASRASGRRRSLSASSRARSAAGPSGAVSPAASRSSRGHALDQRRVGAGEGRGELGLVLDQAADAADAQLERIAILLHQAAAAGGALQDGQGGEARAGRIVAHQGFALEAQRGDGGRKPARGLALVGRADDVLGQPDQGLGLFPRRTSRREVGFDEVVGQHHPGAGGEGGLDVFQRQELAGGGGQRHGQAAQDDDLALGVARTQAPGTVEFAQDTFAQGGAQVGEAALGQPARQALGGRRQGRHDLGHRRFDADQHVDGAGGGEPRERREIAAEIEILAQQVVEASLGADDLGQRRLDDAERQGAGRLVPAARRRRSR